MAKLEKLLKISATWIALGLLGGSLLCQVSCSGCGKKAEREAEPRLVVFRDDPKPASSPQQPLVSAPAVPTKQLAAPPAEETQAPEKAAKVQGPAVQNNSEPVFLSGRSEINSNGAPTVFDSTGSGPNLPSAPSFIEQNKFSQAPMFLPGPPLPAPKNSRSPSGFDSGNLPVNTNNGFVSNNSSPVAANHFTPPGAPALPVASNSDSTPPLPQARVINPSPDSTQPDTAPLALVHNSTVGALAAPSENPPAKTDTELTVAMAEGVLGSAPESAAMGGGFNFSMLALAFPEETSEARKTKISQGDKSYELNLPDTQERYKAEIPLSWVLWAVTAGDIHAAVLPDGTINPEEYAKLEFGEVERPLNGTQEGRLVRVFTCGPLTAPNWNDAWLAMWSNVFGFTPPPPTLADLCSQPTYRDYRISSDKVSVDLPVAGRGALMFVTFNPVDWLKPEFQSAVGAKHIEGEPIPLPPENFKATLEKGELIRAVGL